MKQVEIECLNDEYLEYLDEKIGDAGFFSDHLKRDDECFDKWLDWQEKIGGLIYNEDSAKYFKVGKEKQ